MRGGGEEHREEMEPYVLGDYERPPLWKKGLRLLSQRMQAQLACWEISQDLTFVVMLTYSCEGRRGDVG